MAGGPAPGIRGADLDIGDPVRREWDLIVIAPNFAAALLARELGTVGADMHRRFHFALTYNLRTVEAATESLLSRVLPSGELVRQEVV